MADENKSVHNGPSEEEQYTFVKETIRPKKRSKAKKVGFTIGMAVVFGITSCIVFCLCLPLFSDYFEINSKQITIGKGDGFESVATKTISPEGTSVTAVPTAVPTKIKTEQPKHTSTPKPTKTPASDAVVSISKKIQFISEKVNTCIVKVTCVQSSYDLFDTPGQDTNSTCGIIVGKSDEYLLIYVAQSKVSATDNLIITFADNSVANAKLFNKSDDLGIAIIAVEIAKLTKEQLASVDVAEFDTTYELKTGETVIALGSPNGHMYSALYGTVANEPYNDYIVDNAVALVNTTITYNSNGEGVLVNLEGKIVAFITHVANFTSQLNANVNTCYSIRSIKPIITKLVNKKDSIYFGITANDISPEIAYKIGMDKGIYVTKVDSDSPAFNVDIKKGDIITEINGVGITDVAEFNAIINNFHNKDHIQVTFYRTQGDKKVEEKVLLELSIVE
ncbi:MAG: PDZ domain-containing protein [bacterium]|nr:PDZ domain-containing protein [bacterium]